MSSDGKLSPNSLFLNIFDSMAKEDQIKFFMNAFASFSQDPFERRCFLYLISEGMSFTSLHIQRLMNVVFTMKERDLLIETNDECLIFCRLFGGFKMRSNHCDMLLSKGSSIRLGFSKPYTIPEILFCDEKYQQFLEVWGNK